MNLKTLMVTLKTYQLKKIFFIILLLFSFIAITILFWLQSVQFAGKYDSDLFIHMTNAIANGGSGYSLEGKIVVFFDKIIHGNTILFSLFLALLVVLTPIATGSLLSYFDRLENTKFSLGIWNNCYIGLWAIFSAPIVIPKVWTHFYRDTLNMNAWHNSTSMEMRFFSIIALVLFFKLFSDIKNKKSIPIMNWFILSVVILLSTWFKPSFFVGFLPMIVLGVFLDYCVFHYNNWNYVKKILILGVVLLPSLGIFILQYLKLYGFREDVRLVVSFGRNYPTCLIYIGLFLIIPVLVFIYNRKRLVKNFLDGNTTYVLIWGLWTVELMYHLFLTEEGRIGGNIIWGLRTACFFVATMSFRLYWQNLLEIKEKKSKSVPIKNKEILYKYIVGSILIYELICGLYYFYLLLSGEFYYI